ncbi:MAG: hypothetical protein HZR80_17285 [Candidatus Heimdallarchaeota archaeon]
MNDEKLYALQDLIDTPKDLHKLKIYESKLNQALTFLLFDSRKLIINTEESSKFLEGAKRIIPQIKVRIDSLIDRARSQELRFRPGTSEKTQKIVTNNSLLFDFIIFSRCWDLKEDIKEIDSLVVFSEVEKLKDQAKKIIENIQTIDELFSSKEHIKTNIQSSEDIASQLLNRFNDELEFVERAGALKGILKLEKPKLVGKSKYYDQLGNIILKIAMSFGDDSSDKPIAIRAIFSKLKDDFPRVRATLKDIIKAVELLDENGLLILTQDQEGLYWVQFKPSESEASIILRLANAKGFLTIEELMMNTNWPVEKATEELDKFVKAGCAIKDASYSTGIKYYFPGLSDDNNS